MANRRTPRHRHRYAVAGASAVTQGANEPIGCLWNPHSSISLYVYRIEVSPDSTGNAGQNSVERTSTRGTPQTSVTPAADNAFGQKVAPPSGAELDLAAYSVAPTVETPPLFRFGWGTTSRAGAGTALWMPRDHPIEVPAGQGLAVVNIDGAAGSARTAVSFEWAE